MRISRIAAVLALSALLAAVGCTRQVAGTAQRHPDQPPLTVSEDGYGVVAGFADAPVRIEIFTEPQCTHCADLQADFGDQLAYYIGVGQLEVTYRPLIFLDQETDGHSARVSNALFLATESGATGTQFQRFVEELWANQDPGGRGPSDDEMADMARSAGMPDEVVQRVAGGGSAVNIVEMDESNFGYLFEVDPLATGTPTVYDPAADEKIDIYDNDWLDKLIQS
ncbi:MULTISPECIES: thioredoxin domain-containing protein [unclassified Mycobacterium]|uniref:DsbA family protein n=1 Tax=unclassified Mycobacterium TaxID=2642494 RepID=UPI00073FFD36|nr:MULTISPECIES: thioredoxin domain-containing protein [unclassified Mycobacterium]KUH83476.1 protein-disulfide isomerase [Mycobacterium sp. GA-1999]KUH84561.1 protein-disulfide isomerase [Mycobacterium sp. IS-1556]KUH88239.1 protein-disulfide isomerase [Mycobacterium sp. GA-0227b]